MSFIPRVIRRAAAPVALATTAFMVQQTAPNQNAQCGFFDSFFGPNIDTVKKDIKQLIEEDEAKRGNGTSIAPTLVRLAWHASGTYSKADGTGGSNGSTMRMKPECGT